MKMKKNWMLQLCSTVYPNNGDMYYNFKTTPRGGGVNNFSCLSQKLRTDAIRTTSFTRPNLYRSSYVDWTSEVEYVIPSEFCT